MRRFSIYLTVLCFFVNSQICPQPDYGKTIISFSGSPDDAVSDLQNILSRYNAGNITLSKVPLEKRTGQEFYLAIQGNNTEIKYTTQNSLENAVYTYLERLGFRWYGPGDNWFIKPKTIKRADFTGQWIRPSFRNRSFVGSGGLYFSSIQSYDSTNTFRAKWLDWLRRNRINMDFGGVGHTGEVFYLQNKTLLDKHPGWFLNSSGQQNGRIKIDSPAAVNAYKNWIHSIYEKEKGDFITLGVDPADGRGGTDDPLPKNMPGIKNYSDKWWWLANDVAKDYENEKNVRITMYAYGGGTENAKVPSFKLRENVYPVIIPYSFQTAYIPEQMVRAWAKSINGNMGIYDYWNIAQRSLDVPHFNIYTISPKLKLRRDNKVNGVFLETTNAAGPMGHALWMAGEMLWNTNLNFDSLYSKYLQDCFGNASPYLKNMFDRWSKNYQGSAEPSFSLQDLKNASSAVKKGSPEWKRINELKAYVHYLKLVYGLDRTQPSKDSLFRYLYGIHHLLMVQTAALATQPYVPPVNNGNIVPPTTGIRKLSEDDIENQFKKDLNETPKPYTLSDFKFNFDKAKYTDPIPQNSWLFGNQNCRFFFKAPFTGKLTLEAGAQTNTPFTVYTDQNIIIDEEVGTNNFDKSENIEGATWKLKMLAFRIVKGEIYHIQTRYGNSRIKIITQGIVLFKHPGDNDFLNSLYPVQYFYVPKSATEIIFYDERPEGFNGRGYLVSPDGLRIKRESTGFKDIYRVPVTLPFRGKVWSADFGHPIWKLLNIPNISSLQKFGYSE